MTQVVYCKTDFAWARDMFQDKPDILAVIDVIEEETVKKNGNKNGN